VSRREEVGIEITARNMASKALRDVGGDLTAVGVKADSAGTKMTGLSRSGGFQSVVMGVGMGAGMMAWNALGGAISTAVDFLSDAVTAASNLAESTNKAQVVFGAATEKVAAFASTSATAFGISKRAAYEATGTFGNLLLSAGLAKGAAADMSVSLVQLAADIASFNNANTEDVFLALRSGLVGEIETMRRYGVMMSEAMIKAKGMALGIAGAKGEMSEAAKVQARYALILEQTGTAQGDFARTSDGLANTQKSLDAALEDVSAEIGQRLVPFMLELARVARDDLVPALGLVADALGVVGDVVKRDIDRWDAYWKAAKPPSWVGQSVWDVGYAPQPPGAGMTFPGYKGPTVEEMNAQTAKDWKVYIAQQMAARRAGIEAMMVDAQDHIARATAKMYRAGTHAMAEAASAAAIESRDAGWNVAIAFGDGAQSAQSDIVATGTRLMLAWQHPLNIARVKSMLAGALHAKALVDGLNAGDPAVRGASASMAVSILTYLDALKGPAFVAGQNTAWALAKGLESQLAGAKLGGIMAGWVAVGQLRSIWPTYQEQIAKLAVSPGTIQGNKDLAAAIKALGGSGLLASEDLKKLGSAAADAKAKLKGLADDAKVNLATAFDNAKTSARTFFDELHSKNSRAISDANDLANAILDSQIGAISAEVQAARDALSAVQEARQLASLQAAIPAAQAAAYDPSDPTAAAAHQQAIEQAQEALSDFLAEQNIKRLEQDARLRIDALELQQKANDDAAALAQTAEDARYAAQVKAFDKEMAALLAYLNKHPAAWKATSDKVLKLLTDNGVTYAAAGANLGKAFADGLLAQEKAVTAAAKALAAAAAAALKVSSPAKVGPLAEDQSKWGERLGQNWVAGLQRGLAEFARLPALVDVRATLQGAGPAPILPSPVPRALGSAASGVDRGGASTVYLNVTVAGGIVDPAGTIGQQIADSLILPLRRALDRNGIGLAVR